MLPDDVLETLRRLAQALRPARGDWWVIGSAAVALHGVPNIAVRDIDVVMSIADASHLLPTLGLHPAPGSDHPTFRSAIFATWTAGPLPVELMAGFEHRTTGGWRTVRPTSRERIEIGDTAIFAPSKAELHDLLLSFGRPKDIARARLLAALD